MYYFLNDNHNSRNKAKYNKNEYERIICENCGSTYTPTKGIYNFGIKGRLRDFYQVASDRVISEKFLNVLRENGYTGFEVREAAPVTWNSKCCGAPIDAKYYLFEVTGRCGLLRDMNGEPYPYCKKCHNKFPFTGYTANGVSFDPDSYDGSDIFAFENLYNIPIVSEEIKKVLTKSKLTNLRFVPLNEYSYGYPMKQESALKWINEGEACDELIEAWLKYGVITEDDLKNI